MEELGQEDSNVGLSSDSGVSAFDCLQRGGSDGLDAADIRRVSGAPRSSHLASPDLGVRPSIAVPKT
jgi:hypothetical protein